jgi:hypothetical protein
MTDVNYVCSPRTIIQNKAYMMNFNISREVIANLFTQRARSKKPQNLPTFCSKFGGIWSSEMWTRKLAAVYILTIAAFGLTFKAYSTGTFCSGRRMVISDNIFCTCYFFSFHFICPYGKVNIYNLPKYAIWHWQARSLHETLSSFLFKGPSFYHIFTIFLYSKLIM